MSGGNIFHRSNIFSKFRHNLTNLRRKCGKKCEEPVLLSIKKKNCENEEVINSERCGNER
jgi:hypothetical protein